MTTLQLSEQPERAANTVHLSTRTRSPGYPSFSLKASLEKAKAVYEHEKRNPVSVTALAAAWGLNVKSSTTFLSVSSLKKFGLLEDVDGGKERLLKLSQVALNIILNDQEGSQERITLLKQCALAPKIHADLWNQYNGDLPSDTSLKRHLIVEMNFNDTSVDSFIKQFRETIAFANLSHSDKITIVQTSDSDTKEQAKTEVLPQIIREPQKTGSQVINSSDRIINPSIEYPWASVASTAVLREFTFPLPAGVATLKIPFPLREEDFEALLKTLNVFKEGMVKSELTTIDCNSPNWEEQARSLAGSKMEFNLIHFDFTFNIVAAKQIASDNNLSFRFYPNNGTAMFRMQP